jgi:hypothetical protein
MAPPPWTEGGVGGHRPRIAHGRNTHSRARRMGALGAWARNGRMGAWAGPRTGYFCALVCAPRRMDAPPSLALCWPLQASLGRCRPARCRTRSLGARGLFLCWYRNLAVRSVGVAIRGTPKLIRYRSTAIMPARAPGSSAERSLAITGLTPLTTSFQGGGGGVPKAPIPRTPPQGQCMGHGQGVKAHDAFGIMVLSWRMLIVNEGYRPMDA